ncbi:MAG: hypothetical protein GY756_23670, partial [bacterium]|nr:hypothetical protein [bacterium]
NNFLKNQFLSITLIPCDENFTLLDDKKIEIQNHVIDEFNIQISSYGFQGYVDIRIPVKYYVTKLFDMIKKNNPIKIKIEYFQTRLNDKEDQQKLDLEGYIESEGIGGVKEELSLIKWNSENKLTCYNMSIILNFTDKLKYFFSKHRPCRLYQNKTYSGILSDHLNDLKIGNLLKISVDSKFKELSSTSRDLVVLPFHNQYSKTNLYHYWIKIISDYGGYLYLNKDGSYLITKEKQSQDSTTDDLYKFDKNFLDNIKIDYKNLYDSVLEVYNSSHTDGSKERDVKSDKNSKSEGIFKNSQMIEIPYQSKFDHCADCSETQFQREFSHKYEFTIEYNGLPMYCPILPNYKIKLSSTNWRSIFNTEDIELNTVGVAINIKCISRAKLIKEIRDEEDFNDDELKKFLAPQAKNSKGVQPIFSLKSMFKYENSTCEKPWKPEIEDLFYPIYVHGIIVVPDDIEQKYDNNNPYYITDGNSQNPADRNTEKQDSDSSGYSLSSLPEHYYSLRVKLPVYANDSGRAGDVIISVPIKFREGSNQNFLPYANKQCVKLALYPEEARIVETVNNDISKFVNVNDQISDYQLGPNEKAELKYSNEDVWLSNTESGNEKKLFMSNGVFKLTCKTTE